MSSHIVDLSVRFSSSVAMFFFIADESKLHLEGGVQIKSNYVIHRLISQKRVNSY